FDVGARVRSQEPIFIPRAEPATPVFPGANAEAICVARMVDGHIMVVTGANKIEPPCEFSDAPLELLKKGEVHLWCAFIPALLRHLLSFEAVMSEDERVRMYRYFAESDRRRFTLARGLLRFLLGHYLAT